MKNLIQSTLFLGAALIMGVSAQAQSTKAHIPFAFQANGKAMPAGDYTVAPTSGLNNTTFAMRNSSDGVLLTANLLIGDAHGDAKLVFIRALDGYYLTELWDGDTARRVTSPRSRNSFLAGPRVIVHLKK
jgi:hypothetical protein